MENQLLISAASSSSKGFPKKKKKKKKKKSNYDAGEDFNSAAGNVQFGYNDDDLLFERGIFSYSYKYFSVHDSKLGFFNFGFFKFAG